MSNIRRLTPAPLPTSNAWVVNTLLPKQEDKKAAVKPPSYNQNLDIDKSPDTGLQSQSDELTQHGAVSTSNSRVLALDSPQPIMAARITNKQTHLVNVGKTVKIKKPAFPRSKDIKGGNGLFKYKIVDDYNKPILQSSVNMSSAAAAATTTQPFLKPDIGLFAHPIDEAHSPMSEDSASIPSPILIPSSNTSLLPHSPAMFSSPQLPPYQMVVYSMPMYLHSAFPHSSPQLSTQSQQSQSPSSENKRGTIKGSIKKQLQYYFSTENLCKDTYLRSLFDKTDGKLRVAKLVEFNRLKVLTHDGKYLEVVLEAARELPNLDILEGNEFIRLKTWKKWVMP
ncbi:LARP4 [Candida margitis]|uniref:LARP4 n=1 Tax=Candida margitis TaxID=1775924 RepID=UPI0022270030|nr:LARP4 [Candida margitis]KAI5968139.1 LARP4 [Candida margitis]